MRRYILALSLLLLLAISSQAAVPQFISYQGYLADNIGDPVADGVYSVEFTIYDAAVVGTPVWTETQNVTTTGGFFAVLLGEVNAIEDTVFNGATRFLGVKVAADPELTPRTAMVSVPYAQRVSTVDGASGGNIISKVSIGNGHTLTGDSATITGGSDNTASGRHSTVGGGLQNTAEGLYSTVGGGRNNTASSYASTIGGGFNNTASIDYSTVSGGRNNFASGQRSTVGGGATNKASTSYSTVSGGLFNLASGAESPTVGGGHGDTASGSWSTVPGGYGNRASGHYSFAVGRLAKANHLGSFVWADATGADMTSQANNHFVVRASGGYKLATNAAASIGVYMTPGASSWTGFSDSTMKRNIRLVDYEDVLAKVDELPIKQWSFKSQSEDLEHMGPMAQDFYRLFGLDEDDRHINTIDPSGVALAAIKGLSQKLNQTNQKLEQKDVEISVLQSQIDELKNTVSQLVSGTKTSVSLSEKNKEL